MMAAVKLSHKPLLISHPLRKVNIHRDLGDSTSQWIANIHTCLRDSVKCYINFEKHMDWNLCKSHNTTSQLLAVANVRSNAELHFMTFVMSWSDFMFY